MRARILWNRLKVDVFTSQLVAYVKDPSEASEARRNQTKEMAGFILQTRDTANVTILGADFNDLGSMPQLINQKT